jgi:hypothetical protein
VDGFPVNEHLARPGDMLDAHRHDHISDVNRGGDGG